MIKSQFILDVLNSLLDRDNIKHVKKQIEFVEDIEYEYTGVGVYVSFKPVKEIDKSFLSKIRVISGATIESDELELGGTAILYFNDKGVIDVLEIVAYGTFYPQKDLCCYALIQDQ